MSYRITYGQRGSEADVYNPDAGVHLVSAKASFETNVSPTLDFEMPPDHPLRHKMLAASSDMEIRVYEDDEEILRGRITSDQGDIDRLGKVSVEDQQAYLNDILVRPYANYYVDDQKDQLPLISGNLAQHLIEAYNARCTKGREFSFLGSEVDVPNVSQTSSPTIRDELNDTIYEAGGYITVKSVGDDRTVRFRRSRDDGSQEMRFGVNITKLSYKRDFGSIVTAIIPKGKHDSGDKRDFGLEEVQNGSYGAIFVDGDRAIHAQAAARYGYIEKAKTYEASTPDELFKQVEQDLVSSALTVESVDVEGFDLHQIDPSVEPLRLNRRYRIVSEPHEIDQMMPLTSMSIDLCDPTANSYHFGLLTSSLSRSEASGASSTRQTVGAVVRRQNSTSKDVRDVKSDVEDLSDGMASLKDSVDEALEAAREAAKNTAFGVCETPSDEAAKTVAVKYPLGGDFELLEGSVISVEFREENSADAPTLDVNGTGALPIMVSGVNQAIWSAGQTVLLMHSSEAWSVMSSPVWAKEVIVGDPRLANFYTNGEKAALRVASDDYVRLDKEGASIGFAGTSIDVSDRAIEFMVNENGYGGISLIDKGGMDARTVLLEGIDETQVGGDYIIIGGDPRANIEILAGIEDNFEKASSIYISAGASILIESGKAVHIDAPDGLYVNGVKVG